jgi:predicted component of type VI protein secretion system
VFKKLERKLEKAVEGSFGRTFKASVQPVELAHKLAKEMGDNKTVSVSRVYVPNVYEVYLAPQDYEHFRAFEAALGKELSSYLIAHAQREGFTLVGPPLIELHSDEQLRLGEFGIATRTETSGPAVSGPAAPGPAAPGPSAASPAPSLAPVAPPSGFAQTVVMPGAAAAPPAAARTVGALVLGQDVHELVKDSTVIGRSRRCDVVLADPNTSRQHAEVRRQADAYTLIDLESTNGVFVNGRPVRSAVLQQGDIIELGATRLRFERHPC